MKKKKQPVAPRRDSARFRRWLVVAVAALLVVSIALFWMLRERETGAGNVTATQKTLPPARFVGGRHCAGCHQQQTQDWHGSHHDLAMQKVDAGTVLGDFDNAEFEYAGVVSRFFREGDNFRVETDGPDGELAIYDVEYVFGVEPLQQYLLALPGGRLQALGIAWDSRPVAEGGQRWFHLYADENVTHRDPLHWTRRSQNWNFMCAECHSTNLRKNFNPGGNSYDTQWTDIDVSCEACHGPASNHLKWADPKSRPHWRFGDNMGLTHRFTERAGVHWTRDENGKPQRSKPRNTETEIQVCAACHSRRAQLFEDDRRGQPLMESFLPSLLEQGLYHSDGQINDEVYVYGSFLQSKMHAEGVTCSDCHNPHSLQLKVPGDGLCLQCHSPDLVTAEHHFHTPGKSGSACVDCHMPSKNFMVVDARRDHSFRIPRPDLSVELGVPNACNGCHDDKSTQWAADAVQDWLGHQPEGYQNFAHTLAGARARAAGSEARLIELMLDSAQPAIARATAAQELRHWQSRQSVEALAQAVKERDPLIRAGALQALPGLPVQIRWELAAPPLSDSVRGVRLLAAQALSDVPATQLPAEPRRRLAAASREYIESQEFNSDTPGALVNLARHYADQGRADRALEYFHKALELDPAWLPATINLTDFLRTQGRDSEGEALLLRALDRFPRAADLHHSVGLLYVRQKRYDKALQHLRQATELAPENPRFAYVYAVALKDRGDAERAREVVEAALGNIPGDPSLLELRRHLSGSQPRR